MATLEALPLAPMEAKPLNQCSQAEPGEQGTREFNGCHGLLIP
jgi:hypothetical protein